MQEYRINPIEKDQIVPIAEKMKKEGVFLVMIHGFKNKEGKVVVTYDYAVDPVIESYHVVVEDSIPTISHMSPSGCRRKIYARRQKKKYNIFLRILPQLHSYLTSISMCIFSIILTSNYCIYFFKNIFSTQQKLTKHCKATIPQ